MNNHFYIVIHHVMLVKYRKRKAGGPARINLLTPHIKIFVFFCAFSFIEKGKFYAQITVIELRYSPRAFSSILSGSGSSTMTNARLDVLFMAISRIPDARHWCGAGACAPEMPCVKACNHIILVYDNFFGSQLEYGFGCARWTFSTAGSLLWFIASIFW